DRLMSWLNDGLPTTPDDIIRLKLKLDDLLPGGPAAVLGADLSAVLPPGWTGSISLGRPRLSGDIVFGFDTSDAPFYVLTQPDELSGNSSVVGAPAATTLAGTFGVNATRSTDPIGGIVHVTEALGHIDATINVDLSNVAADDAHAGKLRFSGLGELAKARV